MFYTLMIIFTAVDALIFSTLDSTTKCISRLEIGQNTNECEHIHPNVRVHPIPFWSKNPGPWFYSCTRGLGRKKAPFQVP
jgi:hypothetical protein